jgi:type I restriction enzyme S subunit
LTKSLLKTNQLPKGWIFTKLFEITDLSAGKAFKKAEYSQKGIRLLQIANVSFGKIIWDDIIFVPNSYLSLYPELNLKYGDVIMALNRPLLRNKLKVGILQDSDVPAILYQRVGRFDLYDNRLNKYLFYFLQSDFFINSLQQLLQGIDIPFINKSKLLQIPISVSPLNEQKIIVSKLEELFTKLDAGIEYLKRTQILLKQYRQSVLKYAFEGKLTERWRKENNSKTKIESNITDKIKVTVNDIYFVKSKNVLSSIPSSWIFTTVAKISEKIHYGYTASSTKQPIGPKFLRITDIQNDLVDWNSVPYCSIKKKELDKYILEPGDLVFARTGATVGKSYLIEKNIPKSVFASYLIRIKLKNIIERKFLYAFFHSYLYWNQIHQKKIGTGQPNVNGNTLSKLVLPFPPIDEQKVIVNELEKSFSLISNIEKVLINNDKYIQNLRKSILKVAFEGKLVSQDPNDEPAAILLERIKRERESTIPIKKEKSKITKRKSIDNDSKQMRLM